ncbi:MAG TPA: serine/threonine-protein kinase [Actinomycetota bacterium]|nr:serine/threonine-protein kinase [Actinomycetota bacterium]
MEPEPSWNWPPGHELAPGLLAWALLGDGRRCETWLAWDLGRWCPVAVKLPRPGQQGRAVAALAQEAEVAARTAHPGIRRLLESRLDQPLPQLVFEYVEGPTLDDALDEDGPFHPVDVLLVGMQLAAALGHLHGRGLAHLDVKPGNVVLREGRPVLIDLGLARPVGEAPVGRHRRGSPPWMAPEQVRRLPASPGMDLFALGAVLFELATGTQAFDPADHGPAERRWPQLAGPPPRASSRNPEVPPALDLAVATLLTTDPDDRPAAAGQVLALLAGAMPADADEADRLWPIWATGRLDAWQASTMARPPLASRPA